ncbi:NAD-dependent epimerase/dehydratase family protein [Pendulispora albinea]|uniref:NAD-dependent epimerase/dehydratase family protein n=1 Tax=Pendulispora albinea TaxID=2741071 RepID=A0ABZ2LKA3_9BACT
MGVAFVTGGSGFVGRALIGYLVRRGFQVRALARSSAAAETVRALGASAVDGDVHGNEAVLEAMKECDVVYHAAAFTQDWGDANEAWDVTVVGTENMLDLAQRAGVPRFVHVGTEAVLLDGAPIVMATEEKPIPRASIGIYPRTKAEAERRVLRANVPKFATVVVRPRFIWGKGDTTLLPKLVEAAQSGVLRWFDGGRYLTSTCHIDNVCEGLLKAAEHGRPGEVYFLTDGKPVEFRRMISAMLRTQGVAPPTKSMPRWLARMLARTTETLWRLLRLNGRPPLPYASFLLMGQEVTVDDSKARREIGYQGFMTIEEGLRRMHVSPAVPNDSDSLSIFA